MTTTELVYEPLVLEAPPPDPDFAGRALALEAASLAGDIDGNRWQLCRLAHRHKRLKTRHWAEIIGVAAKRKDGRVREWANVAGWVDEAGIDYLMPEIRYSAIEVLYKFRRRVPLETMLEVLDVWQAEQGLSVETLAGNLQGLLPPPAYRHSLDTWRCRARALKRKLERGRKQGETK